MLSRDDKMADAVRLLSCVPIPLRIVKSPIIYLTFVENVIGSRRDENVLPFEHRKRLFKMNSTPLFLTEVITRRAVLLTSSVSMVVLQFSEVGLQGFSKS